MTNAIENLRAALADDASPGLVERAFAAAEDDVTAAVVRTDGNELAGVRADLRSAYAAMSRRAPEGAESQPAFHLGRLAALVEVCSSAMQRARPGPLMTAIGGTDAGLLLEAVAFCADEWGGAESPTLSAHLDWHPSKVSRQLKSLRAIRLVRSAYRRKVRVSYLTTLGRQELADCAHDRLAEALSPPPTDWRVRAEPLGNSEIDLPRAHQAG